MVQEDYPGIWRYIILAISLLEILCFCSIMNGWGSLVYVLKEEGFFAELCPQLNQSSVTFGDNSTNTTQTDLNPDCDQRDAQFNLYYTLISSIGTFLVLFVGHSLTKLGTRTTRLIFITAFGLGCLCIIAADTGYPWLICVGGILILGSGCVYLITSAQFTKLFPGHSSTIVGLMNGMKVSSSFTQHVVKIAKDNGVGRRISYCCLLGLVSLTYLTTIFLFPRGIPSDKEPKTNDDKGSHQLDINEKEKNKKPSNKKENKRANQSESKALITSGPQLNVVKYTVDHETNTTTEIVELYELPTFLEPYVGENIQGDEEIVTDKNAQTKPYDNLGFDKRESENDYTDSLCKGKDGDTSKTKRISARPMVGKDDSKDHTKSDQTSGFTNGNILSSNMCGYLFIFNVLWFTIIKFWSNYFFGITDPLTEKITHHNKAKVSYYDDLLAYTMAGGIIGCLLVGLLYDWQRRFFENIDDLRRRRAMSSVGPLISTSIVCLVLSGLLFVDNEWVLIALPIVFTLFRALLVTVGNAFLVDMFPASIYGTLYGVRYTIANVFSLIQFALFEWSIAYKGAELHVDIFVLCLCLPTLIHPLSIILANRNTK